MSAVTGGSPMSAVPVGTVGTSKVPGADPEWTAPCVVSTTAGFWMTPIVGGVSESGERSSLARENPHTTKVAATTTPTVEPMRTRRDRRFASIVSATSTTLSRRTAR